MNASRSCRLGIVAYDLWTCLGRGPDAHADALRAGRSGLRADASFGAPACLGRIDGVEPLGGSLAIHRSRAAELLAPLVESVAPAVARLGVGKRRIGVAIGTSTGGLDRTEAMLAGHALAPPYDLHRQHAIAALAELSATILGAEGPRAAVSTACTSGAKVFALARRWFELDLIDVAIVGASDGLCATTVRGFHSLGVLADVACRPFSESSAGMNVAEGAAILVLGRAPAELSFVGYGESSDAHHVAAPDPSGAGAEVAMREALADAGLTTVDYVNAHGTGTLHNDRAEASAIARVFGEGPFVSSTKGATGHLLGAAGAVEAALGALVLERGFVPPSLGADEEARGIRVAHRPVEAPIRSLISSSLAFGGSNAALVLARSEVA